ncbi:histo-blood group ABO system transferase-like isoform 1-T2 [Anomaloglossus baeobatrachus]|uniref:histo-blood group ABO system transferase-like n=1 Tax=Anomaloglossus baeobatrachus TaxID=238106 RepID=UPI003F4F4BD6
MQPEKNEKSSTRKCFCVLIYLVLLSLASFCWINLKRSRWHPQLTICDPQTKAQTDVSVSRLEHLPIASLESMLYEKPNALKPPRTDVLMLTPWLAPIIWEGGFNIDILNAQFHQRNVHVGLTVFAIKKYTVFLQIFIETAEKFFMVGHKVNYYVFTDRIKDIPNITVAEGRQLVVLEVPSYQRWQDVSMRRMEMIRDHSQQRFINEVDYLVCVDVDMKFSDYVGVEILTDVFGTLHPGFYGSSREHFTFERRKQSTACIPPDEGDFYYAGGYFGGTVEEVFKLTNFCHNAMMTDKANHIEAIWHDESYLNKYFLYHKPTKILSPEYLWDNNFGGRDFLKKRRFVAVPKNHNAIRNRRALNDYSRLRAKLKFLG